MAFMQHRAPQAGAAPHAVSSHHWAGSYSAAHAFVHASVVSLLTARLDDFLQQMGLRGWRQLGGQERTLKLPPVLPFCPAASLPRHTHSLLGSATGSKWLRLHAGWWTLVDWGLVWVHPFFFLFLTVTPFHYDETNSTNSLLSWNKHFKFAIPTINHPLCTADLLLACWKSCSILKRSKHNHHSQALSHLKFRFTKVIYLWVYQH